MTIFEDPLYQKYLTSIVVEGELRRQFIRWMNTQIPYFDFGPNGKDIVEVKQVTYVQDRFGSEVLNGAPENPNAIINIIIKTPFGFSDTVRRVPFSEFGTIGTKMREEFQYFIDFRKMHYELCEKINEKYLHSHVTNGEHTYKITKIEYHAMPLFYSRPDLLEKRIIPKEYWLK